MKWTIWFDGFVLSFALVLLQSTKTHEDVITMYEDDAGETVFRTNYTLEERLILIPYHFTSSLNYFAGFLHAVNLLFMKIFLDNDVTSVYNLATLSHLSSQGITAEEHFFEMLHCIFGYPNSDVVEKDLH